MLPRRARLKRSRDFQAVYRTRKAWATPRLSLHVRFRPAGEGVSPLRLGFVISKKVARRAHDRNRLKRRLREIGRLHVLPALRAGRAWDALFVARAPVLELDFAALWAEVDGLCRQAGLLE